MLVYVVSFHIEVVFYFILLACIVMEEVYNKIIYQQSPHDVKLITTLNSFNRKMVLTLRTSGMTLSLHILMLCVII